ncbi:CocE/NonD family hydrolase [Nocardia sp. ET3-3]|uniref:CocE/NonD family hydrolase n=2 Tax=Nocardia terrae TaxID=2675851 RepID=A0A7K1UTJ3_9NOCA|nr:CocE/NonD family hydrolase [Nocardia terrae]
MRIGFDLAIPMADGISLCADVYLPETVGQVPVIMTMGPYGKGRRFQDEPYASRWLALVAEHPEILEHSPCEYLTYETVDPQVWTAAGYAVVRVDSRGSGASPGHLEIFSEQETRDFYEAIEWAGVQPWSSGKVGLCGISYYAINQWRVAALQPPHLAAICPWEGAVDSYRDMSRHGGILSNVFYELWYPLQVLSNQHGLGDNGPINPWTAAPATGAETLTEQQLAARRTDPLPALREHPFDDAWHRARTPDLSKITVPVLSAANWFGQGMHNRGNFEGFAGAGSADKWLEIHPGRHEEWFYLPRSVALLLRFFDHFLKGEDNRFTDTPRITMSLPDPDGALSERTAQLWPPATTTWSPLHLHADGGLAESSSPAGRLDFDPDGAGVTFTTAPLEQAVDLVGPLAARLQVSTTAADADLVVTVRALRPDGTEVTVVGSAASAQPLSSGWLRLSQRALDPERSLPWRPWHPHTGALEVRSGEVYTVDVEIWPTGMHLPAGYRLALTIAGSDFTRDGQHPLQISLFLHTDPNDRPAERFAGTTSLHFGPDHDNLLLVPETRA